LYGLGQRRAQTFRSWLKVSKDRRDGKGHRRESERQGLEKGKNEERKNYKRGTRANGISIITTG